MCGCFCWALPLLSCCFAALATKRKSGWGICGSSCCVVVVFFFCDLICLLLVQANCAYVPLFSPLMSLSGPCHSAFTANPEEKKKLDVLCRFGLHNRPWSSLCLALEGHSRSMHVFCPSGLVC